MATMVGNRTKLVIESAEAVLGLHWFVARDYTAKDEGLEFEIITPGIKTKFDWNDPRSRDHHLVSSTNYQKAFEQGKADIYRACEWGQIRSDRRQPKRPDRRPPSGHGLSVHFCAWRFPRGRDRSILPAKKVGVQLHQGSHYATLAMMEGFMPREEINSFTPAPLGSVTKSLMSGETDAATLMEPWVTFGAQEWLQGADWHLLSGHRKCRRRPRPRKSGMRRIVR